MASLRSIVLKYPGSYGLNTQEATQSEEDTRFAAVIWNGIVDSAGKLTARKDFVNQTTGFSNTVEALFGRRNTDATETIISAAAGKLYSGVTTLTERFDYSVGSQYVDVGGGASNGTSTGLDNDSTTYGVLVSINGGSDVQVTVNGSSNQTYGELIAEINPQLTQGGSCSLSGGNLRFLSDLAGSGSAVEITNSAGTASAALLSALSHSDATFVAIRTVSEGTTTDNNWQFATLGANMIAAQAGQRLTILNESYAEVAYVGQPWTSSPNVVITAYGRMWVADDAAGGNRHTIWWSDLLDATALNSGDAGNIDLTNAWPAGQDSIVALAAAFGRLIVFGRKSILLYTLPADNDPASMTLDDSITDLGCVARDSVVVTDTGVYFLSDNGIYRIDRLGEVTSLLTAPQISLLYNDDILDAIEGETEALIRGGFYPVEGFYVLSFPTQNVTFCVHTRKLVPDVERPVGTKWKNVGRPFRAFAFNKDQNWYSGGANGVHEYTGYTPDGASNAYDLEFTAQWLPFEDETREKILKTATTVAEAASGQTGTFKWSLDYIAGTSRSESFTCDATEFAEDPGVGQIKVTLGGRGKVMQPTVTFPINGDGVTLHQIQLYATPGAVKP
jgi:hypothetical protein